jgi:hypothetical protein
MKVRAAHGRGQPRPAGQLAGASEPADVADLGQHDQGGELSYPWQRGQRLDPRVSLGMLAQLAVDPVGQGRQAAGDRQGVGHDLAGDGRQFEPGQPAAARPGQVAAGAVEAEIGHHRVDPVLLLGAQPDQPGPVPQQRPQLADRRRGDPRLWQQVCP